MIGFFSFGLLSYLEYWWPVLVDFHPEHGNPPSLPSYSVACLIIVLPFMQYSPLPLLVWIKQSARMVLLILVSIYFANLWHQNCFFRISSINYFLTRPVIRQLVLGLLSIIFCRLRVKEQPSAFGKSYKEVKKNVSYDCVRVGFQCGMSYVYQLN